MGADRGTRGAVALAAALLVGGGLGYALFVLDGRGLLPLDLPLPDRATSSPTLPTSPPAEASAPSAGASAAPPEASAPVASPSGAPAASETPGKCLRALFPDDTFTSEPKLPFVCEESNASTIASQLKTKIVVEGRGRPATGGMKEWAVLGFYEIAAVAVLRGRCCPDAAAIAIADAEPCKLGEAIGALSDSARPGTSKDDRAEAVKRFDGEVRCLMKIRQTKRFGHDPLLGGEASTFDKTTARLD